MSDLFSLEGDVIVVTGGLGHLGGHYIRAVLERGGRVASIDISAPDAPGNPHLEADPSKVLLVQADVSDKAALQSARSKIEKDLGPITGLVNNAALDAPPDADAAENGPFETYPEASWDRVMEVNAKGVFLTCQVFAPAMAERGRGSVVNISSIYGVVSPDQRLYEYRRNAGETFFKPIAYSASKSAILNMTRYLATYWGPQGIRVNTLSLGGVQTDQDERFVRAYEERVPLQRMATPDDYVGALIFLLSEAGRYVTGANLVIDGGWTAW